MDLTTPLFQILSGFVAHLLRLLCYTKSIQVFNLNHPKGVFPSILKVYIENIYAIGIVTTYDSAGLPVGLCKASELIYVTSAGGQYIPDFSYGYIEALSKRIFGIPKTRLIKAEMLDVAGADAEQILAAAMKEAVKEDAV